MPTLCPSQGEEEGARQNPGVCSPCPFAIPSCNNLLLSSCFGKVSSYRVLRSWMPPPGFPTVLCSSLMRLDSRLLVSMHMARACPVTTICPYGFYMTPMQPLIFHLYPSVLPVWDIEMLHPSLCRLLVGLGTNLTSGWLGE